ncbi:hypothetical protein BH10BAC1_BH10BAC1_13580 [soil metagenome]
MNLFEKNIFSASTPVFTKINASEQEKLTQIIRHHYPTLTVTEIYSIGAIEINSNNWKVITTKGEHIFKRSEKSKYVAQIAQASIAYSLTKKAFPTVEFVENKEGQLISCDEEHCYCLTNFKEGLYFGSSNNEWNSLLTHLKLLLDWSVSSNINSANLPVRSFFTEEENKLVNQLERNSDLKQISKQDLTAIISEYKKLMPIYKTIAVPSNASIYHVDIHPHNLLFKENKLELLTDFEGFQTTNTKVSLGFGIYKCMRQLLVSETSATQQEAILKMNNEFEACFPYSLKELLVFAKMDVLKRILYILKELIEKGESKWLFILETQLISLKEIDEIIRTV